jgi:hypothetical protein
LLLDADFIIIGAHLPPKPMRNAFAIVSGVIVGGIVVGMTESLGHSLFPPPPGLDVTDPEQLKTLMSQLPVMALVIVVVAWALGALAGGYTAARVANTGRRMPSLVTGGFLLLFGGITMFQIPHPVWMMIAGILLPVPMALLGARLAGPPKPDSGQDW